MKKYLKELQKMNNSDLTWICKELGIKCSKNDDNSVLINKLVSPLKNKKTYKMGDWNKTSDFTTSSSYLYHHRPIELSKNECNEFANSFIGSEGHCIWEYNTVKIISDNLRNKTFGNPDRMELDNYSDTYPTSDVTHVGSRDFYNRESRISEIFYANELPKKFENNIVSKNINTSQNNGKGEFLYLLHGINLISGFGGLWNWGSHPTPLLVFKSADLKLINDGRDKKTNLDAEGRLNMENMIKTRTP